MGIGLGYVIGNNNMEEDEGAERYGKDRRKGVVSNSDSSVRRGEEESREKKKMPREERIKRMTYEQVKRRVKELFGKQNGYLSTEEKFELYSLAGRWGELAPQLAFGELKDISGHEMKNIVFVGIILGWGDRDVEALAQYYQENKESLKDTGMLSHLVGKWVKTSPERAWEFVNTLKGSEKRDAAREFIAAIAQKDITQLGKYVLSSDMPAGWETLFSFRPGLLKQWQEGDATSYEQWLDSLPDDVREKMVSARQVRKKIDVINDPDQAVIELNEMTKKERDRCLISNLWEMERNVGLLKGLDWLKKNFPEGDVMHVLDHQKMTVQPGDFAALENWIQESTHDRIRARALRELSYSKPLPGHDMTNALDMAWKVGWEDRYVLMKNMLTNWVQVDEQAAFNWLNSPRCPEYKRQQWQEEMNKVKKPLFK